MTKHKLKCGFCGYSVRPRWRYQNGKLARGKVWMAKHLEEVHPEEYRRIVDELGRVSSQPGAGWSIVEESGMSVHYRAKGPPIFVNDAAVVQDGKSLAQRMDEALVIGGNFDEIARELGVTPSLLRKHIKQRRATGRWGFVATGRELRGVRAGVRHYMVTAGRLVRH